MMSFIGTATGEIIRISKNGVPEEFVKIEGETIGGTISAMAMLTSQMYIGTESGTFHVASLRPSTINVRRTLHFGKRPIVQIVPDPNGAVVLDASGSVYRYSKGGFTQIFATSTPEGAKEHTELPIILDGCVCSLSLAFFRGTASFAGARSWTVPKSRLGLGTVPSTQKKRTPAQESPKITKEKRSSRIKKFKSKTRASLFPFRNRGLEETQETAEPEENYNIMPILALALPGELSLYALPKSIDASPVLLAMLPLDSHVGTNTSFDLKVDAQESTISMTSEAARSISCHILSPKSSALFPPVKSVEIVIAWDSFVAIASASIEKGAVSLTVSKSYSTRTLFPSVVDDLKEPSFLSVRWADSNNVLLLTDSGLMMALSVDHEDSPIVVIKPIPQPILSPRELSVKDMRLISAQHCFTQLPNKQVHLICENRGISTVFNARLLSTLEQADKLVELRMRIPALQAIINHIHSIQLKEIDSYTKGYIEKAWHAIQQTIGSLTAYIAGSQQEVMPSETMFTVLRFRLKATLAMALVGGFEINAITKRFDVQSITHTLLTRLVDKGTTGESILSSLMPPTRRDIYNTISSLILAKQLDDVPWSLLEKCLSKTIVLENIPLQIIEDLLKSYTIHCLGKEELSPLEINCVAKSAIISIGSVYPIPGNALEFAVKHNLVPFSLGYAATPTDCPRNPTTKTTRKMRKLRGLKELSLDEALSIAQNSAREAAQRALRECEQILLGSADILNRDPDDTSVQYSLSTVCHFLIAVLNEKSLLMRPVATMIDPHVLHVSSIDQITDQLPRVQKEQFRDMIIMKLLGDGTNQIVDDERFQTLRSFLVILQHRKEYASRILLLMSENGKLQKISATILKFLIDVFIGRETVPDIKTPLDFLAPIDFSHFAHFVPHEIAYEVACIVLEHISPNDLKVLNTHQTCLLLLSAISKSRFFALRNEKIGIEEMSKLRASDKQQNIANQNVKLSQLLTSALFISHVLGPKGTVQTISPLSQALVKTVETISSFPMSLKNVRFEKFGQFIETAHLEDSAAFVLSAIFSGYKMWPEFFTSVLQTVGVSPERRWLGFVNFLSFLTDARIVHRIDIQNGTVEGKIGSRSSVSKRFCEKSPFIPLLGQSSTIFDIYGEKVLISLRATFFALLSQPNVRENVPDKAILIIGFILFSAAPFELLRLLSTYSTLLHKASDVLFFSSDILSRELEFNTIELSLFITSVVTSYLAAIDGRSREVGNAAIALFDPHADSTRSRARRAGLKLIGSGFHGVPARIYQSICDRLFGKAGGRCLYSRICMAQNKDVTHTCHIVLCSFIDSGELQKALELLSMQDFFVELDAKQLTKELADHQLILARVEENASMYGASFDRLCCFLAEEVRVYNSGEESRCKMDFSLFGNVSQIEKVRARPLAGTFQLLIDFLKRHTAFVKKQPDGRPNTDWWTTSLSLLVPLEDVGLRRTLVQNTFSDAIQLALSPKEASLCFLSGFEGLRWEDMREELIMFLEQVRSNATMAKLVAEMVADEKGCDFLETILAARRGVFVSGAACEACGEALIRGNLDENIVIFSCGHSYHVACAPDECDCLK
eukprot:gnl/Chilomastix_cuspidata/6241.p1 GENE.gnl/Chilomastix_cuspidata/6241~~gnl/Chilomastix_cuspidata/6241.p1  ORF type:complete len:1665 (-),score=94.00 gnl/Chilomastix_cuspidata/6241:716-5452(-)